MVIHSLWGCGRDGTPQLSATASTQCRANSSQNYAALLSVAPSVDRLLQANIISNTTGVKSDADMMSAHAQALLPDVWMLLTGVFDGTNIEAFTNGESDGATAMTATPSSNAGTRPPNTLNAGCGNRC